MSSPGTYGPARCTGWALAGPGEAANPPSTRPTAVRRSAARLHRSFGHEFTRATVCLPDCSAGRSRGPPGTWRCAAPGAGRGNRAAAADWSPRGIEAARKPQPAAEMAAEIRPAHHLRPEGEGCPAVGPASRYRPRASGDRRSCPPRLRWRRSSPRTENLMTKRLLVTAVVSLGATALTFVPSTHLGGL